MKLRASLAKEKSLQKETAGPQEITRTELPTYHYTTTHYTTRYNPNNTSNTYLEMERAPLRSSQSLPHQNTTRSHSISHDMISKDQSYSKRKVTKTSKNDRFVRNREYTR
ncbi:uncharacterized protein LOC113367642 [Ctenocephalides felis]|uniref:uncharacterized protein LOC113367642 n=1 Tax=Ctenocephalides felis TaxID=7515 RepID=UPI000E6E232B|nr:uncharacterized protein LOC113367642 [Ctenocephalides felis]